ncbi:hypothetical protein Tco_0971663 [Tanacetum coccineum]
MLIQKKGYLLITKEQRESCALMCLSDLTGKMLGFEVIVPGKATMEHTIIPSTEAKSRKYIGGAQNLLRIAIQIGSYLNKVFEYAVVKREEDLQPALEVVIVLFNTRNNIK